MSVWSDMGSSAGLICGRLKGMLLLFATIFFHGVLSAAASNSADGGHNPQLEHVRLQLKWRHQFQFAGYYAALERGFYREAGLDVEICEAREGVSSVDSVLKGQSHFGIHGTDLVRYRAAGSPVVAVAAIFQHSPAVIACREDSGIQKIADIAGKRIYMEPDAADLIAFLRHSGITTNHFVNPFDSKLHDFSVQSLIEKRVDGMYVYSTDELFTLSNANVRCTTFSPRNAGIDFYSDVLFTTEKIASERPGMVKRFREATLQGWEYALAHKEEMAQLILARYSQRLPLEHLRYEANETEKLLESDVVEIGYMSRSRWESIIETYARLGMLEGAVDLDKFLYTAPGNFRVVRRWKELAVAMSVAMLAVLVSLRFYHLAQKLKREYLKKQASEAALTREVEEHKRARESIAALSNLGIRLSAARTAKQAAEIIMEVADQIYGWDACKLDLYSHEKDRIYQVLVIDTIDGKRKEFPPPYDSPHPSPLTREVIQKGAKLILNDPAKEFPGVIPFGDCSRPSASLMFVPIRQGTKVVGIATIQSYTPDAYKSEDLQAFQALADHCGGAMERLQAQEERERLIQQLQSALAEVKTLSGLLPMCAHCKKIRDDRGYWSQVEVFIREHSSANFTHGICPECAKRFFLE